MELLMSLAVDAASSNTLPTSIPNSSIRLAAACFLQYEEQSGMNKICYYDCLGSLTAITIDSYRICPVLINR